MDSKDTQLEAIANYLREHLPVPMLLPLMMKLQLLGLTDRRLANCRAAKRR
jgi:hypothetical protein